MFTVDYLATFTSAYIECALWASTDDDGEPIGEENYSLLSEEAESAMNKDCADFVESNRELLDESGLCAESAGHDFWLTRCRHGAGFWDRGLGEVGDKLTDAAHAAGECDLYFGDNGSIYLT